MQVPATDPTAAAESCFGCD